MESCNANPAQCNKQAMTAAALVLAPLLAPITSGSTFAASLLSGGRMLATEVTMWKELGTVGYCAVRPQGCLVIIETAAGIATNSSAPSAPSAGPVGKIPGAGGTVGGPGRVQTRINIANGPTATTPLRDTGHPVSAGFDHVVSGHFDVPVTNSRSVFNISPGELKDILQSKTVVSSPVTALGDGQFVRTVDVGRTIGTTTLKEGGSSTSFIKVFTDRAGNLITAFPIGSKNDNPI